jgi:hypothetical protein
MSRAPLLLLATLALAACGKIGDPIPPQPDAFPHQYPAPEILPETGQPSNTSTPPPATPRATPQTNPQPNFP